MKKYLVHYFDGAPDEITGRLKSFDAKLHIAVFDVGVTVPLTLTGVSNVEVM